MPLIELQDASAVRQFISQHSTSGCVVTFSAHWCGPCKQSKPALQQLASASNCMGIVYEDALGEEISSFQIRAFPTYVLFRNQAEVKRVEGVNLSAVQGLLQECATLMTGAGETLGGGGSLASPADARAARLAKLEQHGLSSPSPPVPHAPADISSQKKSTPVQEKDADTTVEPMQVDGDEEGKQDVSMETTTSATNDEDPVAHLNAEALETLTSAMGFTLLRAQKGLFYGNGGTVEGAVDWLMSHQDDEDIDDPIVAVAKPSSAGGMKAQSYKCNECGKVLSNMANLELHANKTGHSDFEESTEHVVPLTAEQKAAKIAEIKDLVKAKRIERENAEKAEEKEREKQRRFMGQEMSKTREQLEMEQRKRDAMLRRKEKEDAKRERERIRAELAKDKAERAANKGKLQSKLGVEGYHPDAIQYDVVDDEHHHAEHHKKLHASAAKIDEYIAKVSGYKAGGDGGKCLKILKAYVGNVADHPGEEKYKTIKMDNNAFKTKVKPFIGAKSILLAVGFSPNEEGDALILQEDADMKLLTSTKEKLEAALIKYG